MSPYDKRYELILNSELKRAATDHEQVVLLLVLSKHWITPRRLLFEIPIELTFSGKVTKPLKAASN